MGYREGCGGVKGGEVLLGVGEEFVEVGLGRGYFRVVKERRGYLGGEFYLSRGIRVEV